MKKIKYIFAAVLSLFAVSSCSLFNQDFKKYLKDYTEEAAIERIEFAYDYPVDKYGRKCVPSDEDLKVILYLRNPQKTKLQLEYIYPAKGNYFVNGVFDNLVTFTPLSGDYNLFEMTIPKSQLEIIDKENINEFKKTDDGFGGFNLTADPDTVCRSLEGSITVTGILPGGGAGDVYRSYKTYHFEKLAVNSNVDRIKSAKFQSTTDNKYVICLNIPIIANTVHAVDTKDIYIGNNHWTFTGNLSNLQRIGTGEGELTTTKPSLTSLSGSESDFEALDGYFQAYFITDKTVASSAEEIKYSIKIEDTDGLNTIANVSTKAKELEQPTVSVSTGGHYDADEETGYYSVKFDHSGKSVADESGEKENCGTPTIFYTIKKAGIVYKKGSGKAGLSINLPMNKNYSFEAYAAKDYYVDSNPMDTITNVTVSRSSKYYVSSNGNDDTGTGALKAPYATLGKVFREIEFRKTDENLYDYEIYLMSNLQLLEEEIFDAAENIFFFYSEGNLKINTVNSRKYTIDSNSLGSFLYFAGTSLEISNIKFTNNLANFFQAIRFDTIEGNSLLKLTNCDFENNKCSGNGGALYIDTPNTDDKFIIKNCTFTNTTTNGHGGAVFLGASADFVDCTFENNSSENSFQGGAVYIENSSSDITFTNCSFTNNSAADGGAIYYSICNSLLFTKCNFTGNKALGSADMGQGFGGVIDIDIDSMYQEVPVFDSCTLKNNTATTAGGAFVQKRGTGALRGISYGIKGLMIVQDNYVENNGRKVPNNIELYKECGCLIIDDTLSEKSKIFVTVPINSFVDGGSVEDPSYVFTLHYKGPSDPSTIFTCDNQNFRIGKQGNEVSVSTGYGYLVTVFPADIKLSLSHTLVLCGNDTKVQITAKIGQSDKTSELKNIKVSLSDYGESVSSTYYSLSGSVLTIKSTLPVSNYIVNLQAEYEGTVYHAQLPLKVVNEIAVRLLSSPPTEGTYVVETKADLLKMSEWTKINHSTFENVTFNLTEDIVITESDGWWPLGTPQNAPTDSSDWSGTEYPFKGTFNGNGCKITLPKRDPLWNDAGLVITNEGIIENVVIEVNCSESDDRYNASTMPNPGSGSQLGRSNTRFSLIAFNNRSNGIIRNCITKGTIRVKTMGHYSGICHNNDGLIENCINTANITVEPVLNGWAGFYAGISGIVTTNKGIVKNCVNYGTLRSLNCSISAPGTPNYLGDNYPSKLTINGIAAAICLESDGTINNCYWDNNCVFLTEYVESESHNEGIIGGRYFERNIPSLNFGTYSGTGYFSGKNITFEDSSSPSADLVEALNDYVKTSNHSALKNWIYDSSGKATLKF